MYNGNKTNEKTIKSLFDRIDYDKNGYIDYEEFLVASLGVKEIFSNSRLRSAFN